MKKKYIPYCIRLEPSLIEKYKKLAIKQGKKFPNGITTTAGVSSLMRKVLAKYADIYF